MYMSTDKITRQSMSYYTFMKVKCWEIIKYKIVKPVQQKVFKSNHGLHKEAENEDKNIRPQGL